ncbi:MAG: Calx-beta domain-containing protein [bacterium]|nr:Calx-beta domain-containing protein [bacterium]
MSSPTNATISSAVGTVTITDNDLPPIVNISSPADVDEGEPVVFPVTLTTVSGYPTTVTYSTYDDSALSGTDYIASSGNVMIAV